MDYSEGCEVFGNAEKISSGVLWFNSLAMYAILLRLKTEGLKQKSFVCLSFLLVAGLDEVVLLVS